MKKILLLASVAFIGSQLAAQITITSNNVISAGQKITQYSDNSTMISVKVGGSAKQNFDFSNLLAEDTSDLNFFNPDWKPAIGNLVIGATLVVESDGDYTFLKKTSSAIKLIGNASDTGNGPLEVTAFELPLMLFPLTYGTSIKDSSIFSSQKTYFGMSPGMGAPVIDSFEIIIKARYTFKGIGFGSVKLPNNLNIDNALMVEAITENYVGINFYSAGKWSTLPTSYYSAIGQSPEPDTSISHIWWTNQENYGFPLVQYEISPNEDSTSSVDYISSSSQATATSNVEKVSVSVYPNPSASVLLFTGLININSEAVIMDMQGKIVASSNLKNGKLDIGQLTTGNYIVNINNGDEMVQIKFTKE